MDRLEGSSLGAAADAREGGLRSYNFRLRPDILGDWRRKFAGGVNSGECRSGLNRRTILVNQGQQEFDISANSYEKIIVGFIKSLSLPSAVNHLTKISILRIQGRNI
jgi:hypothetical protein